VQRSRGFRAWTRGGERRRGAARGVEGREREGGPRRWGPGRAAERGERRQAGEGARTGGSGTVARARRERAEKRRVPPSPPPPPPPQPPPPRSLPPPPRGQRRRDQWTCAGVPRHHGDLLATARNKMATAPPNIAERWRQNLLPLGLLFVPKLRINGQTPSNRIFLSPKVLTSRATFSPTRPPAFPSRATSDAIRPSSPRQRAASRPTRGTEFPRLSAASDRNLGNCALLREETFLAASRDRSGESRRNGVRSAATDIHGKWTGPIRESGRILSVLPITHSMRETPVLQLLCRTVGEHASDR
jgi:hypothetical protein